MFFDSWMGLLRVLVVGPLAYVALVATLRISGKRTLSKLNAFDLVVTVALGSTLATILLSESVALAEGVLAMAVLVGLQYLVATAAASSAKAQAWIKSEPRLLVHAGRFLDQALADERMTRDEVEAAVRGAGQSGLSPFIDVVLETDGSLSVVRHHAGDNSEDDPARESGTVTSMRQGAERLAATRRSGQALP